MELGRCRPDWPLEKIEGETERKSRECRVRQFHRQLERLAEKLRLHRDEGFAPNVAVRVNAWMRVGHFHRSYGAAER